MNLRQRTLLSVGGTLACLIGGMYLASSHVLLENSERLEAKETEKNLDRFSDELAYITGQIHSTASAWSNWDDTYRFMVDHDPRYVKSNLQTSLLDLDFMLFLDRSGKVYQYTKLPRRGRQAPPEAEEVRSAIGFDRPDALRSSDFAGLVALRSGGLMISVRPIVRTDGRGTTRGWTVFGLRLDKEELTKLCRRTHLRFELLDLNPRILNPVQSTALAELEGSRQKVIHPLDGGVIQGFSLISDRSGHAIKLLQVSNTREIYAQALVSQRFLLAFIAIAGLVFGVVILVIVEVSALSRVSNLSSQLQRITTNESDHDHVHLPGDDELSWLANTIDGMVQKLRAGKIDLLRRNYVLEQAVQKLASTTPATAHTAEGIAEINDEGRIVDYNPSFAKVYGYDDQVLSGLHWRKLIVSEDHEKIEDSITEMIEVGKSRCEVRGRRFDGALFYLETVMVCTSDSQGPARSSHWFTTDISDRKEIEAKIEHQAFHDNLTGLPNRAMFVDRLKTACQKARRRGGGLGVLFIDLDEFKTVNDSMGHEAGDELLKAVAGRIQGCTRQHDTVARLGGDEFTILLVDIQGVDDAIEIAERITKSLLTPVQLTTGKVFAGASIGIAFAANDGYDGEAMLRNADVAMYQAKDKSLPGFVVFDPRMNALATERKQLAKELEVALHNGQLDMHYQPIINFVTGKTIEVEAFMRWHDPQRGHVSPQLMVLAAEDAGLMDELGNWSLRKACGQLRTWLDEYPDLELTMSVNLSGKQVMQADLPETIADILAQTRVPPHSLRIEVSSKSFTGDSDRVLERIRQFKTLGIRLALDDFGTGSHLISKLGDYPFDMVKIDGTVTWMVETESESRALASAMLIMAKSANIQVVAEGIETLAQLNLLQDLGCSAGQGMVFGKPVPAKMLTAKLCEITPIPLTGKNPSADAAA